MASSNRCKARRPLCRGRRRIHLSLRMSVERDVVRSSMGFGQITCILTNYLPVSSEVSVLSYTSASLNLDRMLRRSLCVLAIVTFSGFLLSCSQEAEVGTAPTANSTGPPAVISNMPSLGVKLLAIDSHWDNNSIALWWDDPEFGGCVNRCVNVIRRRPPPPLPQRRFHRHIGRRDRRLPSAQGPSDA